MNHPASENLAWINGQTLPFADAGLPLYDLGVVAGASVTVMMRTFGHRTFRVSDHLSRLLQSVAELGINPAFSEQDLADAVEKLVEHNCRAIGADQDLGVVAFVTLGVNRTYLGPSAQEQAGTVAIHTFRLPFEIWRKSAYEGVRLVVPSIRQTPAESLPIHLKTRNRLHWLLADRQAEAMVSGSKALLLNQAGLLTETSTSNLFVVRDGEILTPRKDILPGMSRRFVLELASELGMTTHEADLRPEESEMWSEAFLSSTPVCLLPVQSIGDHRFSNVAGPVFRTIADQWSQRVGIDIRQQLSEAS